MVHDDLVTGRYFERLLRARLWARRNPDKVKAKNAARLHLRADKWADDLAAFMERHEMFFTPIEADVLDRLFDRFLDSTDESIIMRAKKNGLANGRL